MNYIMGGLVFWGLLLFAAWSLRPGSGLLNVTMEDWTSTRKTVTVLTVMALVGTTGFLMTLCPMWNGTVEITGEYDGEGTSPSRIIKNKNQYELMADAILDGRLYLEYDDMDPRLLEMENPYDPEARREQKVSFHWDHAFYNGHYYMYFGVVPVFLLFIPFKILTGMSLTTYHATQVFVGASIIGLFMFFKMVSQKFFPKLPYAVYLLMASAISLASTYNCVAKPAMYMTAFSAGICMEIWSVYFYVRAVWLTKDEDRAILTAFFGALFGALAFGCRPPIAVANLVVIPCLIFFLRRHFKREHKIDRQLILKLAAAASPYIVIGLLLMLYNYVRFDSPFEFGQSYQLTVADQSEYGNIFMTLNPVKIYNGLLYFLFQTKSIAEEFPFVSEGGIFYSFPVFAAGLYALTNRKVRARLRSHSFLPFVLGGAVSCLAIILMDIVWSPYLLTRYREDMKWLLGMLMFIMVGMRYARIRAVDSKTAEGADSAADDTRLFSFAVSILAILTILSCIFLFIRLDMEYFTQEQMDWIMDTFLNIRFGVPLPVPEA